MEDAQEFQQRFLSGLPCNELLDLFHLLPEVSFFLKDRAGRFVALNPLGCQYCGVANEAEAIGKTDFDFFPADRAQAYLADDLAVMTSGEAVTNRVEPFPGPLGTTGLVATSKRPLRNQRGRVVGLAGFSRPLSEIGDPGGTMRRFESVFAYLNSHYEEPVRTSELATMAGFSPSQFNRRFREAFGTSARQVLLRIRVEVAARRLAGSGETVASIAVGCGFHDHAHLSRTFQRIMGVSPTEYRRKFG